MVNDNATILENYINQLVEKAEQNTSSTEYLSAITYYRTAIKLLQEKEFLLHSTNFGNEIKRISDLAINQTSEEMKDVFKSVERNVSIIKLQIAELENTSNLDTISYNIRRISNSIDILLNLREKGFHIPDNNYYYILEQVKITANERILTIIKDKFNSFRIECANSSSENFITNSATELLNQVEMAQKILTDASNYNFTKISLDQLSQKIQDAYSEIVSKIN